MLQVGTVEVHPDEMADRSTDLGDRVGQQAGPASLHASRCKRLNFAITSSRTDGSCRYDLVEYRNQGRAGDAASTGGGVLFLAAVQLALAVTNGVQWPVVASAATIVCGWYLEYRLHRDPDTG
jgi:hypothetical protein